MGRRRVLVVEDNPQVLHQLRKRFAAFEVVVCTTLEAAWALASQPWDLWIVDLAMPDGDGFALAEHGVSLGLSVALFTGSPDESLARVAERAGIIFVQKPDDKGVLRRLATTLAGPATPARSKPLRERVEDELKAKGLTEAEREIVRLRFEGLTRAAASERLGISENTHRNHVRNLLEKTGDERLTNLVARLSREDD